MTASKLYDEILLIFGVAWLSLGLNDHNVVGLAFAICGGVMLGWFVHRIHQARQAKR